MNIKGLVNASTITNGVAPVAGPSAQKEIKSEMTHDRDANGQEFFQKQQKKKQKMTREEAEKAVAQINAKHFMKDMHWVANLLEENGYFFAVVKDQSEVTIRKISEYDLWDALDVSYLTEIETSKGNLLRRTA